LPSVPAESTPFRFFWGGSVANTGEIPDALSAGVGDFGDIITPYFPDRMPLNNAVGFFIPQPNSTRQVGDLMMEWHAKYPQFKEELAKQNLYALRLPEGVSAGRRD
jgi:hypothetical protein